MNELYAVDPQAPESAQQLSALMAMFGPQQGRFILDPDGHWLDVARRLCESLPALARARALENLARSHRSTLRTDLPMSASADFSAVAAALEGRVRGLIGKAGQSPAIQALDQVLAFEQSLVGGNETQAPRTADATVHAAWPLLAQSPKVVMIDARLQLRAWSAADEAGAARYRRVVQAVLAEALKRQRTMVFELHVLAAKAMEGDPRGTVFMDDFLELLAQAGASRIEPQVGLLPAVKDDTHRGGYLLGAGCGLHFERGFDTQSDGSLHTIRWLNGTELAPLLERFDLPDF